MSEVMISNETLFDAAECIMREGGIPTLDALSDQLSADADLLREPYEAWWALVASRMRGGARTVEVNVQDVPASINSAFSRIWNEALHEAYSSFRLELRNEKVGEEEQHRHHEEEMTRFRGRIEEAEDRYRSQIERTNEAQVQIKALEAEVKALKASLESETSQRKNEEHKVSELQQELATLHRNLDEARRKFEQRLKDEQRGALDLVSKSEADVRYYRNSLEKVREDAGKKESALTKRIHDLKAELARKDVKIDSHFTQIRSLESELKGVKQTQGGTNRDLSKLNSQLLTETNKSKRLEEKIIELQEELRVAQQKKVANSNEAARRENAIRSQLTERDDELVRIRGRNTSLEKRIISLDEEVRRLKALQ